MNNELKNNLLILKHLVLKGTALFDILQRIEEIEKILSNSIIIPKDELEFEFTEFEKPENLKHIVCKISGPKEIFTYDLRNKFLQENKEEFMKRVKEDLKKKLIAGWTLSENKFNII